MEKAPFVRVLLLETKNASRIQQPPRQRSLPSFIGVIACAILCAIAVGCGFSGVQDATLAVPLSGIVQGGRQPVSGASVQLYASGTKGNGSAAIPLLGKGIKTDNKGSFFIPAAYGCPAPSSQIFLIVSGDDPEQGTPGTNHALTLAASLGLCNKLASVGSIAVNEVTTVGTVWPLAPYMTGALNIGSVASDTGFAAAASSVPEFINLTKGTSPGTPAADSYFNQSAKLNSLADLLASCVNSAGGTAGDGTPCGLLFAAATPASGSAPADTMTAAMNIAQNPDSNIATLYSLVNAVTPFQPLLPAPPADWRLTLTYLVAPPVISLPSGTYTGTQRLTISEITPGASIYYTTDGTAPTPASSLYTGPVAISGSATLQAAAFLLGSESAIAAATLTITTSLPPTTLAFSQQPSNALTGATIVPSVQVTVQDASGNPVSTATNPVTLALMSGDGLTGTLTAVPQNGVATFSNLSVANAGTFYLSASSPGLIPATSGSFVINSPAVVSGPLPAKLAFVGEPADASTYAFISPAVRVALEDAGGNIVSNAATPVTLVLVSNAGIGSTLWTAFPQNGIATFNTLAVSTPGTYTLSASAAGLPSAVSTAFTITAPPDSNAPTPVNLAFLQQPANALAGATISPAVQVALEDSNGNPVKGATNPVTLSLLGGTGLGGTLTVVPVNGVATFGNLSISNSGTGYQLSATSPALASVQSSPFSINVPGGGLPPAAVKLAFVQQPSNALTGTAIAPAVTVAVQDVNGNVVTAANNTVTIALSAGTGLAGTLTVDARNGLAIFTDLRVSNAGSADMLIASSQSLASATSSPFTVTAAGGTTPVPTRLAFLQQPANAATGASVGVVRVAIVDSSGATVTNAGNAITLALEGGSGLTGTLTAVAQNGVATFGNLSVSNAGTYTLQATASGLASAASANFTISAVITPPQPARLAFAQQPVTVTVGAVLSPAITVRVEDANGNQLASATNPVTLTLSSASELGGTLTVTAQGGLATFSNLTVSAPGTYTLTATSPSLSTVTSASFTVAPVILPPIPVKLAFLQQPSTGQAGLTIQPAVTVAVQDINGNTLTTANSVVTLALVGGSGLSGTLTATAQNGIATFSNLSISNPGSYNLLAASPGLIPAQSVGFTMNAVVIPPTPSKLAFIQQPSNTSTSVVITPAVTVAVEDASGNVLPSANNPVTVSLTTGSGLAGTLTVAPQNGVATFNTLLVTAAGTYTLSAVSSGLATATSSSFSIALPATAGTTYYISPTGSDSNNGLSLSSPWLSPNHPVNCGDVLLASSGNYSAGNFNNGKWGSVSCPAANNVAWLQCSVFDTCKISATTSDGIWVDQSYWGVQGWEITTSNYTYGACFHAGPRPSAPATVHHIIFANDVANSCMGGGFTAYNNSTSASVDYIVYIGNIAYNSAHGSGACYSGFNVYQPIASDTKPGTHMFVAGNFSWANVDSNPCAGTAPTDGEGINFDTWDFSQGGGTPYTQQGVIENNLEFLNGGDGIEVENNSAGSSHAPIYIRNNTSYGDRRDNNQIYCSGNGEVDLYRASNVTVTNNLAYTGFATGCAGTPIYALAVSTSNTSDIIDNNFASGIGGNDVFLYADGLLGLGLGNLLGSNPLFAGLPDASAPACSGSTNVAACMSRNIANFTPAFGPAKPYGYQVPSAAKSFDPLFPQWLCSVNLPSGLITIGCQTGP